MSVQIQAGTFDSESKTPFPKEINFEETKNLIESYEAPSSKTKIKQIIKDVKLKEWDNDIKKAIN